jgi:hypothetical protein
MNLVPFGFGVFNLPMLGWLAAAAAPIVIHLLSRRKYRQTTWAAMEYLLAALRRRSRRILFEQWLVLALRALLVALIVVAVAEPFVDRRGTGAPRAERTHRVLVIDGSYSMAYQQDGRSRFDTAKQLAQQIITESPEGDAFSLVLMAAPPRAVVRGPALSSTEVLRELDNLQLVHTSFDLSATVRLLEQLVAAAQRELPRGSKHEVYLLTDLGRVGWLPELTEAGWDAFRRQSADLATKARLVVIDLGQPTAENIAVTGLRPLEGRFIAGRTVGLEVAVRNYGRQAYPQQPVELYVDGRLVGQERVSLSPGGEAVVVLSHRFLQPGEYRLEVRAPGDALEVDNHRWLAVSVRQACRVLCIEGRPAGAVFGGSASYLARALAPQSPAETPANVKVEVATDSALWERDLSQYDCIFLCGVAQFTAREVRALHRHLHGGGNIVFFLGEDVLADRYNRELGIVDQKGLLPALLGPVATEPVYRLDPLDFRHPIVEAFRGRGRAGLLTVPVLKYFRLKPAADSSVQIVLAAAGGDPLMLTAAVHGGQVVLVATSADTSWTALPLWPSFVPLVQEILDFCFSGRLRQRNVTVGEPIGATLPGGAIDAPPLVQGPDGQSRTAQLTSHDDLSAWSCSDTMLSGFYTVQLGSPAHPTELHGANLDTQESELEQLTLEDLRTTVWPNVPVEYQATWRAGEQAAELGALVRPTQLSIHLLYAALAVALAESFLAWRFGHHDT